MLEGGTIYELFTVLSSWGTHAEGLVRIDFLSSLLPPPCLGVEDREQDFYLVL